MTARLRIPYNWNPRMHQVPLWNYMMNGGKRAVAVWHRRAGKDSTALNFTAAEMFRRKGVYWHMLPTATQARKVVWNGIDFHGRRIIDQVFPDPIVKRKNNNEMLIETVNGSMWQLCGSDNYDNLVGSNPVGVVFSEWSIADPYAWDFIRPILAENGGWAVFIYTPRGKNHGHRTYEMALENPNWFCELLGAEDTCREDGSPIITEQVIEEERMAGMAEEKIAQEFFCSWDAGMEGAFYTEEIAYADAEGYHGDYSWNPMQRCFTVWDIGYRDATAIGIFQVDQHTQEPVLVDYIEERNKPLDYYAKTIHELPYDYAMHFGPHDLGTVDWTTGKTRLEMAANLGLEFEILPKLPIEDGISSARVFLRKLRINKKKCSQLIDAIASYRRQYDEKRRIFQDKPYHDWASHGADMIRYASQAYRPHLLDSGRSASDIRVTRAVGGHNGRH